VGIYNLIRGSDTTVYYDLNSLWEGGRSLQCKQLLYYETLLQN